MKLLFLDVDGVLNHPAHWDRALADETLSPAQQQCDPACVKRLLQAVAEADAKIVVSSAHRSRSVTATRERLAAYGIPPRLIIGRTPTLNAQDRGHEIQAWLDEWPRFIDSFVIVDDGDDMAHLLPRLVRVDPNVGLTDTDCARIVAMLAEACWIERRVVTSP